MELGGRAAAISPGCAATRRTRRPGATRARSPSRIDYYLHPRDRITKPLRRREDGRFEEISWEVAVREVAERLAAVRDEHGGRSIFYYGGGGQGNHLPAAYSQATRSVLGSIYKSSALAQEKTGEFWVSAKMTGAFTRGDFEHCEVGVFIGKNPWFSHGIPRARVTLREIAKDPGRCLIVVDPRRSETADLADIHLAPRPGTDAWLLAAMVAVIVPGGPPRSRVARASHGRRRRGAPALRSAADRRLLRGGRRPRGRRTPRRGAASPRPRARRSSRTSVSR